MDLCLSLPWPNRRKPYVALHVKHWGWRCHRGKSAEVWTVGLMAGRFFMPEGYRGFSKWFYPHGFWRRRK